MKFEEHLISFFSKVLMLIIKKKKKVFSFVWIFHNLSIDAKSCIRRVLDLTSNICCLMLKKKIFKNPKKSKHLTVVSSVDSSVVSKKFCLLKQEALQETQIHKV